ncbi:TonB-dependent receptor plug domain-containing protein [Parasphingorhabdus sp.]|uniref:TonB-dependent receptor plug domain-containing protein n=1 Tax=Parasphingorhabdus sp. TaxID=2709688 RepID=UPI003A8E7C58
MISSPRSFSASSPFILAGMLLASPAGAQITDTEPDYADDEIVVTASLPRGAVVTEIPPVVELSEEDIASYGASSVQELLEGISSQTTSSRGRGSGRPIVLINGQRTSGFREIRDLPPEAIRTIQVFPEELALRYGYSADERVVNFILKDLYTGVSVAGEYGIPTAGGQGRSELEANVTHISKNDRMNINLEWQNNTAITESERDIIQDAAGDLVNLGDYRTLAAATDNVELNANYSRTFDNGMSLSLNGGYVYDKARSLRGLPNGTLDVAGDPLFRYFTEYGPLRRVQETNTVQGGLTLNGTLSGWRWSLTSDYTREQVNTDTDRSGDTSALQAAIDAGTVDPFATSFGALLGVPTTDTAKVVDQTINNLATMSGTLFVLPSGAVTTTIRAGYDHENLNSRETRGAIVSTTDLSRDELSTGISVDIPLANENIDVVEAIGKVSLNGNFGYSDLSDFGGLVEFGFGVNWEPIDGLVFSATAIGEEAAPSIAQLGNPIIITPDVTTYDFTNGETVLAAITTGGNFSLPAETRRDIKLAVNYRPEWLDGFTFLGEYFRNNSKDVASSFPLLTPEIEAAFPDRVTRDTNGRLIAIDQRPVNYAEVRSERIRYGIDFSKRFGEQRSSRGGATRPAVVAPPPPPEGDQPPPPDGERGGGRPEGNSASRSGPRGGGGGGGPGAGGPGGGRWQVSAFHTIRLEETIKIRDGVEELDLLDGSAIGSTGGSPRHEFEINGGWFKNGIGFRLNGKHQTATRVDGGLTGSNLRFSDLTTLNLRMFINLDDRGNLTEKVPFLKNSRIALKMDNIFNDIQTVRDDSGLIPLSYQSGYVDPVGRYVEIDFRKRF